MKKELEKGVLSSIVEDLINQLVNSEDGKLPSKQVVELATISYKLRVDEKINDGTFRSYYFQDIKDELLKYSGGIVKIEGKYPVSLTYVISKDFVEKHHFGDYVKEETPVVKENSVVEINENLIDLYKAFKTASKTCHRDDIILDKSMFLNTIKVSEPVEIEEYLKKYIDMEQSKVLKHKKPTAVHMTKFRYALRALGMLVDEYEKASKEMTVKSEPKESITPVVEEPVEESPKYKKETVTKTYVFLKIFEVNKVDNSAIVNALTYFNRELSWAYDDTKSILNQIRKEVFDFLYELTGNSYAITFNSTYRYICEKIMSGDINLSSEEVRDLIRKVSGILGEDGDLIDEYFNEALNSKPSVEAPISEPTSDDVVIPVKEEASPVIVNHHRGYQKKTVDKILSAVEAEKKDEDEHLSFKSTVKSRQKRDEQIQFLIELFESMKNSDGSWNEIIPESYENKIKDLKIREFLNYRDGKFFGFNIKESMDGFTKKTKIAYILFRNQLDVFMKSDEDYLKKNPSEKIPEEGITAEKAAISVPEITVSLMKEPEQQPEMEKPIKMTVEDYLKDYLSEAIPGSNFINFEKTKTIGGSTIRKVEFSNSIKLTMSEFMHSLLKEKIMNSSEDIVLHDVIPVDVKISNDSVVITYRANIELDLEVYTEILEKYI